MSMTDYPQHLQFAITHELANGLSHPAHRKKEGFLAAATAAFSAEELSNLERRYPADRVGEIVTALELGTIRDATRRQNLELENVGHLIWESSNPDSYAERYNALAGNSSRLLEYIDFFQQASQELFARKASPYNPPEVIRKHIEDLGLQRPVAAQAEVGKVALELLGCFQRGNWEGTAIIDDPMRKLREELLADPRYGYQELETPGQKKITYRFEKLPDNKAGEGHAFGVITRRRNVANVFGNIGIFKQSHGIVVIDYLDEKTKQLVDKVGFGVIDKNGAATMVGKQFEADITSEKGASRAIVPPSAHYLMLAKRSTA